MQRGGAPLKEEESVNYSFGFTSDAFDNTNIAVDFYKIEVDDRIYRSGDIQTAQGNTISFYNNAMDIEHQGIDVVITSSADWNASTETKFTFAFSHNEIDVVGRRLIDGNPIVSDANAEDIENNYPENRFVATAVTTFDGPYELMLRANFYGEHFDERGRIDDPDSPTAEIDSIIYIDFEFNYFATEDLTLTLGASNLFDEYVDEIGEGNANRLSVGLPYPRRTAANYEGGSWYLRANYVF